MRVKTGLGGQGVVTMAEPNEPHPNKHFEMKTMRIEKAADGSFIIHHEMGLKKSAMGKAGYDNGYMSRERNDEVHTAAGPSELVAHIKKHFGAKKSKEMTPKPSDEDETGERADSGDEDEY